jgi:lambda family phage minor tail protein L
LKATVTIHDTLAQYLDARNFLPAIHCRSHSGKLQVWYIDGKNTETSEAIEFRLTSPMDLQGLMIPTRQLHSLCSWCIRGKYRSGDGCDYAGTNYFDKNNNPVADPSLDQCNGT